MKTVNIMTLVALGAFLITACSEVSGIVGEATGLSCPTVFEEDIYVPTEGALATTEITMLQEDFEDVVVEFAEENSEYNMVRISDRETGCTLKYVYIFKVEE